MDCFLQNEECTGAGFQFHSTGNRHTLHLGQLIVFAQNQFLAVEQHGAGTHLAVAGEDVSFSFLGQFHGSLFGPGVVDHQVSNTILAVLTGVGKDMGIYVFSSSTGPS